MAYGVERIPTPHSTLIPKSQKLKEFNFHSGMESEEGEVEVEGQFFTINNGLAEGALARNGKAMGVNGDDGLVFVILPDGQGRAPGGKWMRAERRVRDMVFEVVINCNCSGDWEEWFG